jgi:primosomal protein N' (replication factor Y) (superfamily II helicase)
MPYTAAMHRIVQVALPTPLPKLFDYLLPQQTPMPALGVRVSVPFSGRRLIGFVAGFTPSPDLDPAKLKPIHAVLETTPLMPPDLWQLLQFAARYYHRSLGDVLTSAVPRGMRASKAVQVRVEKDAPYVLKTSGVARTYEQAQILAQLALGPLRASACAPELRKALLQLAKRGVVERPPAQALAQSANPSVAPALNAEQAAAVAAIVCAFGAPNKAMLLQGVTGSGKTEVYLAAAHAALARGQSVLVLVPEIGLTPQTLQRFQSRLHARFAVMHSALSDGERANFWQAARAGQIDVLLGTRSAVFAPMQNLGLIVVDEEHDSSYKQFDGFRYSARDLALKRASDLGIPIVLGSATPSLESLHMVQLGRLQRLWLHQRARAQNMPAIQLIDIKMQQMDQGLSKAALNAIRETLLAGSQALIMRNRRGFAPRLSCQHCGHVVQCPGCERPMTVHRAARALRCHYCDRQERVPSACPQCRSDALHAMGEGTERISELISQHFAEWPVHRIDRDTTSRKGSFDHLLAQVAAGGPCILIGTQMLAKGHDLPNIALVVVVGADDGLFAVDFRASERLAQLLMQVAGRAGRAETPGRVLIQTQQPEHPLLQKILRQDYEEISVALMQERRITELPPFTRMAILRADCKDFSMLQTWLKSAAQRAKILLQHAHSKNAVLVYGPMPASMAKRAHRHHAQLVLCAPTRAPLHALLAELTVQLELEKKPADIHYALDVDPYDD